MRALVDTRGHGVVVVGEQHAAGLDRRGDSAGPGVEVVEPAEDAAAGVDEVETTALELERELLDVGFEEDSVRHALARDGGRLGGDVDAGDERTELGELGGRLAGRALQVEHVLSLHVRQSLADRLRDPELSRHHVGAAAVNLVPRSPVVLSGFHRLIGPAMRSRRQ